MQNFTYWNPTKLIFGKGEVEKLPEEIKPYGKTCCSYTEEAALSAAVFMIK